MIAAEPPTARPATTADVEGLVALWRSGGVGHADDDGSIDRREIQAKLGHDPDLFLVIEDGGRLIASVMGTYDGHRGRIKRCVVDPEHRGRGLGRDLVNALEARFIERGITELRLEVWADNEGALAFWHEMGWELLSEIRYFQRSLTTQPPDEIGG